MRTPPVIELSDNAKSILRDEAKFILVTGDHGSGKSRTILAINKFLEEHSHRETILLTDAYTTTEYINYTTGFFHLDSEDDISSERYEFHNGDREFYENIISYIRANHHAAKLTILVDTFSTFASFLVANFLDMGCSVVLAIHSADEEKIPLELKRYAGAHDFAKHYDLALHNKVRTSPAFGLEREIVEVFNS